MPLTSMKERAGLSSSSSSTPIVRAFGYPDDEEQRFFDRPLTATRFSQDLGAYATAGTSGGGNSARVQSRGRSSTPSRRGGQRPKSSSAAERTGSSALSGGGLPSDDEMTSPSAGGLGTSSGFEISDADMMHSSSLRSASGQEKRNLPRFMTSTSSWQEKGNSSQASLSPQRSKRLHKRADILRQRRMVEKLALLDALPKDYDELVKYTRKIEHEHEVLRSDHRQLQDQYRNEALQSSKTIEKLRRDNQELRILFSKEKDENSQPSMQKRAMSEAQQITQLQYEAEKYRAQFDTQRAQNIELQAQLKDLREKFDHKMHELATDRLSLPLPNVKDERVVDANEFRKLDRKRDELERKLKAAHDRISDLESHINSINEKELKQFDTMYEKMQEQLLLKETELSDAEYRYREMKAARDAAYAEIASLSQQIEREKDQWNKELLQNKKELAAKRKAYDYLIETESKESKKRDERQRSMEEKLASLTYFSLQMEQQTKTSNSPDEAEVEKQVDGIKQRICALTNAATFEEAIEMIRNSQDAIKSLRVYIHELNETNEHLEKQVDQLSRQVKDMEYMSVIHDDDYDIENSELSRGKLAYLNRVEEALLKLEADRAIQAEKYLKLSNNFARVKFGVLSLCERLDIPTPLVGQPPDSESEARALAASILDDKVVDLLKEAEIKIAQFLFGDDPIQNVIDFSSWSPGIVQRAPVSDYDLHTENISKFLNQLVDEVDTNAAAMEAGERVLSREELKRSSVDRVRKLIREGEVDARRQTRQQERYSSDSK